MFTPVTFTGKLFKRYLLTGKHISKVRIQNLVGKYLFRSGILFKSTNGSVLNLMPNDWITRVILLHNEYEGSSVLLATKLLENGGVFIDIGANFGLYTCTLSKNEGVQVYAIEPNYMILPHLLKNVQLNKRKNVMVLNTALSNHFQFVSFDLPQIENLGSASFSVKGRSDFSVLSCSLDFIFQSQGIQSVELIKIDIEGNEFDVLSEFSFETYPVKNILLEFNHLSGVSFDELNIFFTKKGFLVKDITGLELNGKIRDVPENNLWLVNTNY